MTNLLLIYLGSIYLCLLRSPPHRLSLRHSVEETKLESTQRLRGVFTFHHVCFTLLIVF